MRRTRVYLFAILFLSPTYASALSCGIGSIEEIVDGNSHIFVAVITSAEFVPLGDAVSDTGKVIAKFEVLDVLKGDPLRVSHVEIDLRSGSELWPAELYIGRRYLIAANDGVKKFTACSSVYRFPGGENWCLEYKVRKRLGQIRKENEYCERALITIREQNLARTKELKRQE